MQGSVQRSIARWVLVLVTGLLVYRLFYFAFQVSQDFHVYWQAVRYWLVGVSPYIVKPEDMGFVFKYPPWMIPVPAPFGWMSWSLAKLVWAAFEIALIFYSVFRLEQLGLSRKAVLWSVFLFWWIWLAHVTAGQITLVLMASALWAYCPKEELSKRGPGGFREAALTVIFSAKIFSMISLLGMWRRIFRVRVIAYGLAFLLVSHAIVLSVYRFHGSDLGLVDLYQGWVAAAASGGAELGEDVVRGQGNHGLTGAVLRWLAIDAQSTRVDTLVFVCLSLVLGGLWLRFSRSLPDLDRWFGWVALGLVVHPLAWHHSFVLAFPLCALALHRSFESKQTVLVALSFLGIVCIGILIPQVIGKTWVKPLELASIKSWGVLISAAVLVRARGLRHESG